MRPAVGIICEYDPFHRGHARQFALVREKLPDARIVCIMSGPFTQRGMPALFSPTFRAGAALVAGADMVLELPCAFAVREAENFALGGVGILHALGFVTHLSFGCETDDLHLMQAVAGVLEHPNGIFTAALKAALADGQPFVAAQASAIVAGLASQNIDATDTFVLPRDASGAGTATLTNALTKPNNILGICYLRALLRLQSPIQPLPVKRVGEYHADSLKAAGYPSASAARKAFLAGDLSAAENACAYPLSEAIHHRPEALDAVLLHHLRTMDAAALRALPDCSEGLENRLAKVAREANSRATLLAQLKTRRYAFARLNRLATHALLGVTGTLLNAHPLPEYVRLLGFRRNSRDLLAMLNQSSIPIIAKAADGDIANPLYALDERAYDLWALGAGLPAGLMYRQPVVIV